MDRAAPTLNGMSKRAPEITVLGSGTDETGTAWAVERVMQMAAVVITIKVVLVILLFFNLIV
jgi:hypothetical protein